MTGHLVLHCGMVHMHLVIVKGVRVAIASVYVLWCYDVTWTARVRLAFVYGQCVAAQLGYWSKFHNGGTFFQVVCWPFLFQNLELFLVGEDSNT